MDHQQHLRCVLFTVMVLLLSSSGYFHHYGFLWFCALHYFCTTDWHQLQVQLEWNSVPSIYSEQTKNNTKLTNQLKWPVSQSSFLKVCIVTFLWMVLELVGLAAQQVSWSPDPVLNSSMASTTIPPVSICLPARLPVCLSLHQSFEKQST